ncbi:neuronal PAS domain-containing protein 4-like [Dunckerocampus dactyliophorus]|uniref:neuronal PAS domain-containing protein 4-like n=1 Tax=Dunckerocampus dactyliophorus TaxID=161453 RepID=UPI00240765AA|nr:neuronal PAS domain-containing protein 4-like [Dunckerocampus dactyliophorus]
MHHATTTMCAWISRSAKTVRSTKGASKARRDHINHEIRNMRALLPIPQEDQERLSYLHSMSAICTYIRKSVLFKGIPTGEGCSLPYEAFLQALHGFILVTTVQGRLVYVSENVAEYLGLSMADVLQGDSIYDMVERSDVNAVESTLKGYSERRSSSERSFICCMQTSRAFRQQHGSCSMLVRGSFQSFHQPFSTVHPTSEPLFVALCSPTVDRLRDTEYHLCPCFNSIHRLDMSFTLLSHSVLYFLGCSAEEMVGRSWYSLIHPEDLSSSVSDHRKILQAEEGLQVRMVLRLQCKDLSWTWCYICANKDSDSQATYICCTNFIISETEARFLQKTISNDAPSLSSSPSSVEAQQAESYTSRGCKRQRMSNSQSEETASRARMKSDEDVRYTVHASSQGNSSALALGGSPALFTPPYSPASSSSPVQQEAHSRDLLIDMHGYADQLLSSPEASPSYYSYSEAALTCHLSPHDSLPPQHTFEQGVFATLDPQSPHSPSSPMYDFPACASDARLVPDGFSVSDMSESSVDCALHQDDFSLLEQPQEGSLHQAHHVPQYGMQSALPTPNQSPPSIMSDQYNESEQAEISILAQQISSLACSFDMFGPVNPLQSVQTVPLQDCMPSSSSYDWPLASGLHAKRELLNDGMLDSLLKDLDMGPTFPENTLPTGGVALDPFTLQLGCHDQNTELHQLNHFMQSGLQQDRLAEENLC